MEPFQHDIDRMNALLDQLLHTARQLRDASMHMVSEEELLSLQKEQEQILAQLMSVDHDLQRYYASEIQELAHHQFQHKLKEFQALNQEFMENLNSSYGLIQFELHRLQEGDEEIQKILSYLHKREFGV